MEQYLAGPVTGAVAGVVTGTVAGPVIGVVAGMATEAVTQHQEHKRKYVVFWADGEAA